MEKSEEIFREYLLKNKKNIQIFFENQAFLKIFLKAQKSCFQCTQFQKQDEVFREDSPLNQDKCL